MWYIELFELITRLFNVDELDTLCFKVGFDYEDLKGSTKSTKTRELIRHCERRNLLTDLVVAIRKEREDEASLVALRTALTSLIVVESLLVYPAAIRPGEALTIRFDLQQNSNSSLSIWLGAQADDSEGNHFFNMAEDEAVIVQTGKTSHKRKLTIPSKASTGDLRIYGGLWIGRKPSRHDISFLLHYMKPNNSVIVV